VQPEFSGPSWSGREKTPSLTLHHLSEGRNYVKRGLRGQTLSLNEIMVIGLGMSDNLLIKVIMRKALVFVTLMI
jgi:hypothetical protein